MGLEKVRVCVRAHTNFCVRMFVPMHVCLSSCTRECVCFIFILSLPAVCWFALCAPAHAVLSSVSSLIQKWTFLQDCYDIQEIQQDVDDKLENTGDKLINPSEKTKPEDEHRTLAQRMSAGLRGLVGSASWEKNGEKGKQVILLLLTCCRVLICS